MRTRLIGTFLAYAVAAFALAISYQAASAAAPQTCFLIVTEHWPQSTKSDPKVMADARHKVFQELGVLLASAYKNGDYVRNPTSFPVHDLDFRDDHIVVYFRELCPRAQLFLGELLRAYRQHVPPKQQVIGPELVMEDRPATQYEARCGVGATAQTCPSP